MSDHSRSIDNGRFSPEVRGTGHWGTPPLVDPHGFSSPGHKKPAEGSPTRPRTLASPQTLRSAGVLAAAPKVVELPQEPTKSLDEQLAEAREDTKRLFPCGFDPQKPGSGAYVQALERVACLRSQINAQQEAGQAQ
jgi:hypothetical protein